MKADSLSLAYNTQREHLIIPEYGRYVQQMIDYCTEIEEDEQRNRVARSIVELVAQMNPQMKTNEEFRQKIWDHLIIISGFKLKVDSPFPYPDRPVASVKPDPLPYPKKKPKFSHYGSHVENLVKKLKEIEEDAKRQEGSELLASYMKLVYKTFHKDSVSDETIKADLETISGGALKLDATTAIESVSTYRAADPKAKLKNKNKNFKHNPHRNKHRFNKHKH